MKSLQKVKTMTKDNSDDLDVAAFLRRGQSHLNPPHGHKRRKDMTAKQVRNGVSLPPPVVHKRQKTRTEKIDDATMGLLIILGVMFFIILAMFYALMIGFWSGLP